MELIAEIIVTVLLVCGAFFGFVGSYSLVRLPDSMMRVHGPTKSATLGVGSVLLASLIWMPVFGSGLSWHELLIPLFLFLTAPLSGNFIAKAIMHLSLRPEDLPTPSTGGRWRTYGNDSRPPVPDADADTPE